jgi:hypothetical protein
MTRRRITLSLNERQYNDLKKLMEEANQTNYTTYGVYLIMQEVQRIEEIKSKRGRGRPQKNDEAPDELYEPDYSDDLPKTINHYGKLIGKQEMADIEERTRMHNNMHKD